MTIFDLLFLVVFFTSVIALLTAAIFALRGRRARTLGILRACGTSVGIYLGLVVLTSLVWPRRVLDVGRPRCFDDWCIAVENVSRAPLGGSISCVVNLRLFSTARRVSQRENGLVVYLTDDRGRRYEPSSDESSPPFNVLLGPGESVTTVRVFEVPKDARELGLVIRHEGGFPVGWFIIGAETWFHKSTIVRFR